MKIPENFGIKKEKKTPEFIDISGKALRNILLCSCGALIIAAGIMFGPWDDVKTSLIVSGDVAQEKLLEEIELMNMTLIAIQQKDSMVKTGHEYLLAKDIQGTTPFVISENTCAHGARLIVRLREEFSGMNQKQSGTLIITGVAAAKNRGAYNEVVEVNSTISAQMRNLPNDMIMDNDTVFVTYKISTGEHGEKVEYQLECY